MSGIKRSICISMQTAHEGNGKIGGIEILLLQMLQTFSLYLLPDFGEEVGLSKLGSLLGDKEKQNLYDKVNKKITELQKLQKAIE